MLALRPLSAGTASSPVPCVGNSQVQGGAGLMAQARGDCGVCSPARGTRFPKPSAPHPSLTSKTLLTRGAHPHPYSAPHPLCPACPSRALILHPSSLLLAGREGPRSTVAPMAPAPPWQVLVLSGPRICTPKQTTVAPSSASSCLPTWPPPPSIPRQPQLGTEGRQGEGGGRGQAWKGPGQGGQSQVGSQGAGVGWRAGQGRGGRQRSPQGWF